MIQKEFIRNELRYRYTDLTNNIRSPEQMVGRPLLFERGTTKYGARIVVCTAEELSAIAYFNQTETLFLCIGSPEERTLHLFDVCVLPKNEQCSAVLNFIQRLFDRLDEWTLSLRQAAETGEGIEDLLSRAGEMLQNPVVLLDEMNHIVAQSEASDSLMLADVYRSGILLEPADASGGVQSIGNRAAPDALYIILRNGGARYILICQASERPIYASDEIVLDSLAGFLRLMLSERPFNLSSSQNHSENTAVAAVFRSLFSEDGTETSSIEALRMLGWLETNAYAVLAVEPADGDLRAAPANAICNLLKATIKNCCAFHLPPIIIAIVQTELLQSDALHSSLQKLAVESKLRIGICEVYAGFKFFPDRLMQAKQALNHAVEFGGVARYSDVLVLNMSMLLVSSYPKELLCIRSVLALAQYDREHETNYMETAEQYVKNHFNAVKTAGELYIHRSTFLYRLERMKSQFGLDLDAGNFSLLHFLLSLQIVKDMKW